MKRGQAALDYMTTYGWVFLVIIATISLLTYFGFLDPSRLKDEYCKFGEQLSCVNQVLVDNTQDMISLKIKNNFPDTIVIVKANGDHVDGLQRWTTIESRQEKNVELIATGLVAGEKIEIEDIILEWKRVGANSTAYHNYSGDIYAEVIDGGLI